MTARRSRIIEKDILLSKRVFGEALSDQAIAEILKKEAPEKQAQKRARHV